MPTLKFDYYYLDIAEIEDIIELLQKQLQRKKEAEKKPIEKVKYSRKKPTPIIESP